jgi:hypothetical protein
MMDETLATVLEYRRAARRIVECESRPKQARCAALVELARSARESEDSTTRRWSERAIWEECRDFLGEPEFRSTTPNLAYVAAQRRLRSKGHDSCPCCLGSIADEADFERWRQLEADLMAELERKEQAVNPGGTR